MGNDSRFGGYNFSRRFSWESQARSIVSVRVTSPANYACCIATSIERNLLTLGPIVALYLPKGESGEESSAQLFRIFAIGSCIPRAKAGRDENRARETRRAQRQCRSKGNAMQRIPNNRAKRSGKLRIMMS